MFSHVDGWEKSAVATIGGGAVLAAAIPDMHCCHERLGVAQIAENVKTPCKNLACTPQGSPRPAARARA
jgi:hypothetical protein